MLEASLACSRHAVLGNTKSGVEVATMTRSISSGLTAAACSAARLACSARSLEACDSSAIWRWTMPVRSRIHASLVSRCAANSSFFTTRGGR
jgi:hypothetical protein